MKARFSRFSRRISSHKYSIRAASPSRPWPRRTRSSTATNDIPNVYRVVASRSMGRMFDPDIWREVTGGGVGERVRRLTRVTPLVPAPALGRRTGADVWLKLENLQRTGSFKLRGAAARLAAMAQAGQRRAIAASAGNHGLGVALAARTFEVEATILVSSQTPE